MSALTTLPLAWATPRRHDAPRPAVRAIAAVMLVIEIATHAFLAPDHLREMPYIGWGFVTATVILTAVLIGVVVAPRQVLPWQVGALVCAGMAVMFVLSRTAGLPSYHEGWTADSNLGLVSLAADLAFLACLVPSELRRGRRTELP